MKEKRYRVIRRGRFTRWMSARMRELLERGRKRENDFDEYLEYTGVEKKI